MFFGRLCHVGHLILVIPATNTVSERSFSTLRRVKSYLRATMNQQRLNHLTIARIYKESLDAMDLTSIADDFVSGNEHRLRIFGKLWHCFVYIQHAVNVIMMIIYMMQMLCILT